MRSRTVPSHVERRTFQRHRRLRQLGYKDYADYLRSPAWSDVKRRYRASDLPQACACGATENLRMHHKTYERVGQERLEDLIPMCESCHTDFHVIEARGGITLDHDPMRNNTRAAAYARDAVERHARAEAAKSADVRESEAELDRTKAREAALKEMRLLKRLYARPLELERLQKTAWHVTHHGSLDEIEQVRDVIRTLRDGTMTPHDARAALSRLRGQQQAA